MQTTKKERDLIKFISDRALFLARDANRLTNPAYTQALSRGDFMEEATSLANQAAELLVRAQGLDREATDNWTGVSAC